MEGYIRIGELLIIIKLNFIYRIILMEDDKKKVCVFVFWKLIKIYDWKKSLKFILG